MRDRGGAGRAGLRSSRAGGDPRARPSRAGGDPRARPGYANHAWHRVHSGPPSSQLPWSSVADRLWRRRHRHQAAPPIREHSGSVPDALRGRSSTTPSTRDDDGLGVRLASRTFATGGSTPRAFGYGPSGASLQSRPRRVSRARPRGPRVPVGISTKRNPPFLKKGRGITVSKG